MIIVPVLSPFFELKEFIIPLISLFNIFTNSFTYIRCRKTCKEECVNALCYKPIIVFGSIGNLVGSTLISTYLNDGQIRFILGIVILMNVLFSNQLPFTPFGSKQFIAGFTSGLLGGSISLGNLGIVLTYGKNKPNELKSFIASFCLFQNIITLIVYFLCRRYSFRVVIYAAISIVICIIFQDLGMKISDKFSAKQFSIILNFFLCIIGLYLLIISM